MKLARWEKILLCLPVVEGLIAFTLFTWQGGWGIGHRKFDSAILWLGTPSVQLLYYLPTMALGGDGHLLEYIILPAVLNFLLLLLVLCAVRLDRILFPRQAPETDVCPPRVPESKWFGRLRLTHGEKVLLCIPLVTGVAAALIYGFQPRTGGGHGKFDPIIGLLGMPSFLSLDYLPDADQFPPMQLVYSSDWILWIILPALMNFLIALLAILAVRFIRNSLRRKAPKSSVYPLEVAERK